MPSPTEHSFNKHCHLQDTFTPIDTLARKITYISKTGNFNYLFWRICRMLSLKLKKQITLFSGNRIVVWLHDKEVASLVLYGVLDKNERKLTRYLIQTLKPNDVFYDIGANYGFYSNIAKDFLSHGSVFAFEPNPEIARCLEFQKSRQFIVIQKAISRQSGRMRLYKSSGGSGKSTTVPETLRKEATAKINIDATTLDSFTQQHKPPTLIKLDVEGAEADVINGGVNFLTNYSGLLIMEIWSGQRGKRHSSEAVKKLYQLGYSSYRIRSDGGLSKKHIQFNEISDELENVIFKKD